jgi:biopolymer transport protein ExbB
MIELIDKGGPIVFLLLAGSLLAVGIFLERFFYFHRITVSVQDLLQGLSNLIRKRSTMEALHILAGTPGPVAKVMHTTLLHHSAPREELKEIARETGQMEVPKLEKFLTPLLSIAYIAPLLGLLGSVFGLLDTFAPVASNGFATSADLARGMHRSLVSAAAGMGVAIPAYILYAYLHAAVRTLMSDMERGGIEVVNLIMESRENPDASRVDFRDAQKDAQKRGAAADKKKVPTPIPLPSAGGTK